MEVIIVHEVRFGKGGSLDEAILNFLNKQQGSQNNNLIIQKLDEIMATTKQNFDEVFARIDAATSEIGSGIASAASKVAQLEERVGQLGLDASVEDEILSRTRGVAQFLEQSAATLDRIGKDQSNPVPVDPPTTTTTTAAPSGDTTTQAPVEDTTTIPPVEDTTTVAPGE
jgi:hypothetical protein